VLQVSQLQTTYLRNGSKRYVMELTHTGLKKHQLIKGEHEHVVRQKARLKSEEWRERWEARQAKESVRHTRAADRRRKEQMKEEAADRTSEAVAVVDAIEGILHATLGVDDTIDWSALEDRSSFPEPRPISPGDPGGMSLRSVPAGPSPISPKYDPQLGLIDKLLRSRGDKKREAAVKRLRLDTEQWEQECARIEAEAADTLAAYEEQLAAWTADRIEWERERDANNEIIRGEKDAYLRSEPDAIEEYCDLVLSESQYPDAISLEHELQYLPETRTLVVETQLPSVDDLPTLREVRYFQSRGEFDEKHLTDAQTRKLYDSVVYQICLRTLHELFEADAAEAIDAIALNGHVTSVDRATGRPVTACILSIQVGKAAFLDVTLRAVDPKACFKNFKGVGSSKLHSLTPVAPIVQFRREDGRFVSAREIADTLNDGLNLAAMDWEDFEHLIRELFEQEFKSSGGEVSVTQASRDGGVDAIAYDPDPIRGGKIVIQAKRYTNTVGVAAVRDLYGTVMNEGATKGILVTTSDYGPDAYGFAKDKPITLLSGANLLHLLQKHGHKARIDLREAKAALGAASPGV
jgi:restriction system protein